MSATGDDGTVVVRRTLGTAAFGYRPAARVGAVRLRQGGVGGGIFGCSAAAAALRTKMDRAIVAKTPTVPTT